MTHRVFVYGTLKSGFPNHYLLEGCEFFGRAVTVPTYKMIENGFPVIIPDPDGRRLAGEIYVVDDETLARLDRLEREGSSYDRKLIDVTLASGEQLPTRAFIYVGREDRFGDAFARVPLYANVNERGELDWKAAASPPKTGFGLSPKDWRELETFSFGDGPELADSLLELVLSGTKRATCWAESQGLLSAEVGKSMVVLDGQGVPKAVLKTIELTRRRFDEVD